MLSSRICIALAVLVCAACSPVGTNPPPGTVTASLTATELVVTNETDKDVFLLAYPERMAPFILVTTTTNPRTTTKVGAKSFVRFSHDRFMIQPRDTVFLAWWHLGRQWNDSLYNPDSVRSIRVFP